jgi:hypothetical protein
MLASPNPHAHDRANSRPASPAAAHAARQQHGSPSSPQATHPQLWAAAPGRASPSAAAAAAARPGSPRASLPPPALPAPLAALRTEEVGNVGDAGSPKRAWSFTSPRVAPLPPAAGAPAAASYVTVPPATAATTPRSHASMTEPQPRRTRGDSRPGSPLSAAAAALAPSDVHAPPLAAWAAAPTAPPPAAAVTPRGPAALGRSKASAVSIGAVRLQPLAAEASGPGLGQDVARWVGSFTPPVGSGLGQAQLLGVPPPPTMLMGLVGSTPTPTIAGRRGRPGGAAAPRLGGLQPDTAVGSPTHAGAAPPPTLAAPPAPPAGWSQGGTGPQA